ncbi:MAG: hypothetical protein ACJAR2_003221 [Ilumatobacter sp.]|jgi:hypothetical protein
MAAICLAIGISYLDANPLGPGVPRRGGDGVDQFVDLAPEGHA